MKSIFRVLLFMGVATLVSCSPKISTRISKSYPALDYKQEIAVLGINEPAPKDAEQLGTVKIGDSGLSAQPGLDVVLEKAQLEARKAGGNVLKITEHRPRLAAAGSFHKVTAAILKVPDVDSLLAAQEDADIPGADYAILNVYRYNGTGAFVGYDLHLGDEVICRVRNNSKMSLKIKKDGLNTLWARTESKAEVPVNIKPGKTYYLRCGIGMGIMVGRPTLELVEGKLGKLEFQAINDLNQQ